MTKGKRARKSLHHAAVERELRRLHEQGATVEKQRDLIRTVLNALVLQLGGQADIPKRYFEQAAGGKIEVEERKGGGLRVTFTEREDSVVRRRSRWWSWLLTGWWERADG
jgi:hypothetical protein